MIDLNTLAKECYELDLKKGFKFDNFGERIAKIHEEVSEAFRAHRYGDDIHIGEELADVILVVLGLTYSKNIDVTSELLTKHETNKTRSYKHGKRY